MLRGSWRAARRPGDGRAGPGRRRLPPASVLARGLTPAQTLRRPRFAYDNIASFGVYPELPASFGVYLTRCSRVKMYQAPAPDPYVTRGSHVRVWGRDYQAPTSLFSVGSKVIRNTLCARRRGSLGTRLSYPTRALYTQYNER